MTRFLSIAALTCFLAVDFTNTASAERPPNVVIIFLDDSGYSDFHPFGKPSYPTPHVEKLAKEGMMLTRFCVPQAICSASRAALLSGCFPERTRVFGAHGPNGRGLDPKFMTMAEMLKTEGYSTAHFGKWHCGDQRETRPLARGFDEHAGLMYSNDMWRFHPGNPKHWGKHPLQFWENGQVKIADVSKQDQTQLTTWATEYSVSFIKRNKDKPFFLYLAHSMPHVPLFVSDKFKGKSGTGLYGDVIMEIDWSVGQVMKALKEADLTRDTLVLFSSDNGPWATYGNHAGSTPFREAKATSFEGGVRSATVLHFPREIKPGGKMDRLIGSIDILPTIAHLTKCDLPKNPIDGKNVWPLIIGKSGATNAHSYYPITVGGQFQGVLSGDGRWKLHLPHGYRNVSEPGMDGMPGKDVKRKIELSLFDMKEDPRETTNVIDKHPKVAEQLQAIAKKHRAKFWPK
ncbi:MAG: sulfatase [Akkermansiaceae bacterium]